MSGPQPMAAESAPAEGPAAQPRNTTNTGTRATQRRPLPTWLPAGGLSLVGLGALAIVVAPAALGLAGKFFFDGAHRPVETLLRTSDGAPDPVTALAWAPATDGPLFIGTQSGRTVGLAPDGSLQEETPPSSTSVAGPVVGIQATNESEHFDLILDLEAQNSEDVVQVRAFAMRRSVGDRVDEEGIGPIRGLLAVADDFNATRFVGAVSAASCPTCQSSLPDGPAKGAPVSNLPAPSSPQNVITLAEWQTGIDLSEPVAYVEMSDVRRVVSFPGKDFVVAGDGSGNLVQIKADERDPERTLKAGFETRIGGHEAAIVALASAAPADGSAVFASAAADDTVKVWRASPNDDGLGGTVFAFDEMAVRLFQPSAVWTPTSFPAAAGTQFARGLAADPDLARLAVVDGEGRLFAVRLDSTAPNQTLVAGPQDPSFAAFSSRGDMVLGENSTITLYTSTEAGGMSFQADLGGEGASFVHAVFDPTGNRLAGVSDDGTTALYDVASRQLTNSFSTTHLPVADIAFNANGNVVMIGSRDGSIEVSNIAIGETFDLSINEDAGLSRVAFSPNGKRLLTLDRNGTFRSVSARTLRGLDAVTAATSGGAFSADGGLLALPFSTRGGFAINIIDTTTGETVSEIRTELNAFNFLTVSNDGRRVVVVTEEAATLWTRTDGPEEVASTASIRVARDGLRLSADGSTLLVRDASGGVQVARLVGEDALRLRKISLPSPALEAELTADGSQIVAGCADAVIRVVPTGATAASDTGFEILGHGEIIHQMAISPDGLYLASASIDGRVRITDLERARWIASLPLAWLPSHPTPDRTRGKLLDPARCRSGFVWRLARPEDLVCVTPDSRDRVAEENATATSRIEPGGGAFGPNTCVSGFVWREAFDGDLVCVTPEIREFVREENRQGPSRQARFAQPAATIEDPPAAAR